MSAFPCGNASLIVCSYLRTISPAILMLSLLLTLSCAKNEHPQAGQTAMPPMEITAIKVVPHDVPMVLDYLGQTEGSRVIDVRARVEGVIQKMNFIEGRMVKAGDVLYRLDSKPFEISLENARAQLAQGDALLENAQRNVKRLKPLVVQNAVSQKDLDDALSAETTAIASVRGAKARVNEAEVNLAYTVIHAPISGIAGRALKQEGSLASPGPDGMLTTVSQLDPMYVNFNVSETDMNRYSDEAEKKTIRFPKGGNLDVELKFSDNSIWPYKGKLNFADPFYNKETGTLGARAVIGNPMGKMLPGLYVRVLLKGAVRPNAILVPQRAVMQGPKGKFVFVVDSTSKVEMRNIEVGEWYGDSWIVTSGLKSGDVVVVDGGMKVQNGMSVKTVFETEATVTGQPGAEKGDSKSGAIKKNRGN